MILRLTGWFLILTDWGTIGRFYSWQLNHLPRDKRLAIVKKALEVIK